MKHIFTVQKNTLILISTKTAFPIAEISMQITNPTKPDNAN